MALAASASAWLTEHSGWWDRSRSRGEEYGAHRRCGLIIEYRLPGKPRVVRFPDTAGGRREIAGGRIARHAAGPAHAPPGSGADRAILDVLERALRLFLVLVFLF